MDIYKKAKEWLNEPPPDNGEPEPEVIASAREVIIGLLNENDTLSQNTCSECSPDNYGWIFNRVEGKAACGCMTEAEPFQILLHALERIMDKECLQSPENEARAALLQVLPVDY